MQVSALHDDSPGAIVVQVFPFASLQSFELVAGLSGKPRGAAWQVLANGTQVAVDGVAQFTLLLPLQAAPLSEQVPVWHKLPGAPTGVPPLLKQSRSLIQASIAAAVFVVHAELQALNLLWMETPVQLAEPLVAMQLRAVAVSCRTNWRRWSP